MFVYATLNNMEVGGEEGSGLFSDVIIFFAKKGLCR